MKPATRTEEKDRILVVDDDAGMRRTVQRVLSPQYDIEMATGSSDALESLDQGEFQVALIDLQLDDGDGYTLCQQVKRVSPETDVILITGSVSHPDEKLFRSLERDAFYFLFKPFERRVLRALVERCLRLQKERKAKERYAQELSEDLEQARRFQQSLLPHEDLEAAGWRLSGRFEPCDALGGDFYFYLVDRDGSVVMTVGDIVGHGVSAAMYAGMLRTTLDAVRRHSPDPEDLLPDLLSLIDFFEGSRYATLFYGQLLPDGRVRYFSAGHPAALWQRSDGGIEQLGSTGLFLTRSLPDQVRRVEEISLEPGDRLMVYTDGANEVQNQAGEELGLDGLESALEGSRGLSLRNALESLADAVQRHRGSRPMDDDLTILLAERQEDSAE